MGTLSYSRLQMWLQTSDNNSGMPKALGKVKGEVSRGWEFLWPGCEEEKRPRGLFSHAKTPAPSHRGSTGAVATAVTVTCADRFRDRMF